MPRDLNRAAPPPPDVSSQVPDTGSLREDVETLLRRVSARLADVGPATTYGLLGDYFAKTESLANVQDQLLHLRTEVMTTLLKRAADRGEVDSAIDRRIATLTIDLYRNELLVVRTPPSVHVIDDIVDQVFLPLVQTRP